MERETLALIAVLLVALLAYAVSVKPSTEPLDAQQAKQFVLEDAKTAFGNSAEFEFISVSGEGTAWTAELKVVTDAHTRCPKIYKRSYTLLPIKHREEVISDNCMAGSALIYKEEAILSSANLPQVLRLQGNVFAFSTPYDAQKVSSATACVQCTDEQEFAKNLPAAAPFFIVEWRNDERKVFVALDNRGNLLGSSE